MEKNYISLSTRLGSVFKSEKLDKSELLSSFLSNLTAFSWLGSLLLILLLLISQQGLAQVANYTFSQSTGMYTPITGGTVVATATAASGAASLDDVIYNVPNGTIPFSFNFDGVPYTGLNISTNGFVTFGATVPAVSGSTTGYVPISASTGYAGAVSALGRDLNALFNILGNTGEIRYETIGSAPNQEFVIQWSNFRPWSTSTSTTLFWRWNFQIRLHENGSINIVYDPNNIGAPSASSAQIGLRGPNNTFATNVNNRLIVTGTHTWDTSVVGTANSSTCAFTTVNVPADGKTLTWTPPAPPACGAPINLSVSDLTFTTADLAWGAPTTGTPASYDWEIRTTGAGGSGATGLVNSGNVIAPTVTVDNATGLTAGTAYNLYVRTNCTGGDGSSTWAGPFAFSTPTPGESCATAATIAVAPNLGAAVNTLLTTGLTSDGPAGTCSDATGNPSKKDRWVAFVAPSSGNKVIVSTVSGSITDAVMQVWSSCPATGVALGCSDDVIGFMPQLEFCSLTPGATYYIQIWPYSATATGNFNVRVYEEAACPVPPSNDECAGVQTITVGEAGSCPSNATSGTTVNATATPGVVKTSCDQFGTYNDVFYKFNSGSNTEINFAFANLTGTNEFGIYSACGTGFLGACSSSSLTTTYTGLTANTDYYIVVWANSAVTAGTFSICISQVPAPLCVTAPTSPANAGTVCAGTTNFSWPAVTSATSYDVFLDNVLVSDNQTGTTYSQVVAAGPHTWSVIPSNSAGSATGCSTFSFTSSTSPVGNTFATAIDLGVLTSSTNTVDEIAAANCDTNDYSSTSTPGNSNATAGNDVFYKFEISQCESTLSVGTCTSSFDTVIHLLDATGARIAGDDDSCTSPNDNGSLISGLALDPGIYYVVVEGFNVTSNGTFTLAFTYTPGTSQIPYYLDADSDSYGVIEDFIIACAPTGNYTALVGGDCNDGNAAINPGAIDICFDGIDNDCSGTASNVCVVAVNVTPSLQNTTLASISTTMSAVAYTYPGAQTLGYRFLITNKTASPNVSVELQSTSRFFSLTQAGVAAYASEFEIKATAVINGQLVDHSGNTITVFTPAAPVIPISSFTCGTQLSRLNATISAAPAFGATAYRFRIRLTSDTVNPNYGYSQSTSRFIGASSFLQTDNSPFVLQYINSYQVAVQYLLLNNGVESWTEFGSECTVTTPAIPLIALASPSCGSQVSSNGATISAQAAVNANQYRFRIRLTSDTVNPNYGYTLPNASRFSQLSAFQGFTLTPSTSYSLAVEYRLMNNGQDVWTGFGTECVIISAGPNTLVRPETPIETITETTNTVLNAIAYPNPFRDSFNLEIKPIATTPIQIVVYDMTGRLLESKSLTVDQANSTPIGSNYPSGVYQVVVSQENQVQTVRVIKQ